MEKQTKQEIIVCAICGTKEPDQGHILYCFGREMYTGEPICLRCNEEQDGHMADYIAGDY
tara:strand:- start:13169 stop:13348 length:180 start_codon:yes stop_codon:yes gene_type:complete